MQSIPFNVEFDRAGTHLTIFLSGELDAACDELLSAKVLPRVHPGDQTVWVDMAAVSFCGSSGVTLLLRLQHQVEASGGQMTIYRPSCAVTRLLELCELDQYLTICQPQTALSERADMASDLSVW